VSQAYGEWRRTIKGNKKDNNRKREKVRETPEVIGTPHEAYEVPKIGFGVV